MNKITLTKLLLIFWGLLFGCLNPPCEALFIHMKNSDKKCFFIGIPTDTTIQGSYKVELMLWNSSLRSYAAPSQQDVHALSGFLHGTYIEVNDPRDGVILTRMTGLDGKFAFISSTFGDHKICATPNATIISPLEIIRMHLNMQVGGTTEDYKKIQIKEKLTDMQLSIRKQLDRTERIIKEQNYQRLREVSFREISDRTNRRVIQFAALQIIVLISINYWQLQHLKEFLTQKKLV